MVAATHSTVEPLEHIAGRPVYKHGEAPKHLRTKSQLYSGQRLILSPGQQPVCYVIPFFHPDERRALYDPADAVPVADQRIGSVWAWKQRRTCPKCGIVREHIVHGSQCGTCWREDQARIAAKQARRCAGCKRVGSKPYPEVKTGAWYTQRLCRSCLAKRKRKQEELLRAAIRCPGGCGKLTATKKQVLDWAVGGHQSIPSWKRYCPPCQAIRDAEIERENAERRARWEKQRSEERAREEAREAARRQELAELRQWAIDVLVDPNTVILDTETTGLHDTARIVDIAVITAAGETLINTLLNPGEPIPAESTDIHGITDEMIADAPKFGGILPDLKKALTGKRVLIYNDYFDLQRLGHELTVHHGPIGDLLDVGREWLAIHDAKAEDVLQPYSTWYGEWSEWHGNYRWQRLGGGHRAHGDCLAVIDCLKSMARPSVYETEEEEIAP